MVTKSLQPEVQEAEMVFGEEAMSWHFARYWADV